MKNTLIFGYGNPGREDDGLGVYLAEQIEQWIETREASPVAVDANFQLNIEDALTISEYDLVLFIDASEEDIEDFVITRVEPSAKTEFTMHAMSPSFILHLCQALYGKSPEVYLLHIKGYSFEMREQLTRYAAKNLASAAGYLLNLLSHPGQLSEQLQECASSTGKTFNVKTS